MHLHILGIAGTFMGSLALIAKQIGHQVTGMDQQVYPPMSTQLDEQNISYIQNYQVKNLPKADLFIIGNALSRGNACVEAILTQQSPYTSGAQWLYQNVLSDKWVLGVSGTHGKTTTASMLTWILEFAGYQPSFLIGGLAQNFGVSSRLTPSNFFVIEADEYDTAFFDKRSKFVHYHPRTLVINNLEFDHADIFDSLKDIQQQFHHLIRTIPSNGLIIYPQNNANIKALLRQGIWSEQQAFKTQTLTSTTTGTKFNVEGYQVAWHLLGNHNLENGLCAIYSAHHVGVPLAIACAALSNFKGVKRRLEIRYQSESITLYDDFAHHPSAIQNTIAGLRAKVADEPIIAILELRSKTMQSGVHQQTLVAALKNANQALILRPKNCSWDIDNLFKKHHSTRLFDTTDDIVNYLSHIHHGHFLVMSNGHFDDIFNKIIPNL